ncbi:NTP transferase domain-containing protein [Halalkalibacter sp. APA_J-10(15)]|uniref:cytidylyltransferase domain-containing protein n=1 Tax=Halalkalibacter sp. APA_J-10(15) TaxID=2933805 RepID=UPI001FF50052|nr:glycosyltransferase family protein [Halalkalibacter sp. APA_J-10(15)]MCK0470518.1 glycosyltransferase family protein [Halalkalibacter sp. APA_J-10(15)]
MKVVAIIQARMGSTRLPGKVLKEVLNKPLLAYQIERVQKVTRLDEIVIATTKLAGDDAIVSLCHQLNVPFYRGDEKDVLARFYEAATSLKADVIVRLTSDCPIIDPHVIEKGISLFEEYHNKFDYISNTMQRTYPRGMDTEVFSFDALKQAYYMARSHSEREHVTLFFRNQSDLFRILNFYYKEDQSANRWTVDTIEDFELIKRIIEKLHPNNPLFTLEDTLQLLKQFPHWKQLNVHVEQKENEDK